MIRREFLQFFDLDFSLAVFDPETNIGRDVQYRERTKLCTALGLTELTDPEAPLLSEIMRLSKVQAASVYAILFLMYICSTSRFLFLNPSLQPRPPSLTVTPLLLLL